MQLGILLVVAFLNCFAFAQTEAVKLRWMNIPYATSYELEVESSGSHGRPLIVRTVAIPEIDVELPPGSYAYRVRGIAAKGKGPWSEKQSFEIKPEAISLLTPTSDFKVEAGSRIRFSWKATSKYRYRIQISNAKGAIVSDRETTDSFFNWSAPSAGNYQWRVAYANIPNAPWSVQRTVRAQPSRRYSAGLIAGTKIERPVSHWTKTFWAGANMNSYEGDFADTGNNVSASTVSGSYAFEIERRHERFSPYSEARPSVNLGVRQQSLVKKTAWLPQLALAYNHLWTLGYFKVGPVFSAAYGKSGFFTADALGKYNTSTFWRTSYSAGLYGEYLFSKFILSPFAKFGASSGGESSLAAGGVKPSTVIEAGIGGKLVKASRWSVQLRFFNEEVKWTSAIGNNSLMSNNWSIDFGGEL